MPHPGVVYRDRRQHDGRAARAAVDLVGCQRVHHRPPALGGGDPQTRRTAARLRFPTAVAGHHACAAARQQQQSPLGRHMAAPPRAASVASRTLPGRGLSRRGARAGGMPGESHLPSGAGEGGTHRKRHRLDREGCREHPPREIWARACAGRRTGVHLRLNTFLPRLRRLRPDVARSGIPSNISPGIPLGHSPSGIPLGHPLPHRPSCLPTRSKPVSRPAPESHRKRNETFTRPRSPAGAGRQGQRLPRTHPSHTHPATHHRSHETRP